MYSQTRKSHHWLCSIIAASLLFTGLIPPGAAFAQEKKRKPVVVTFGQPNIWSLEQAHYLLARMHMANLELQAKALTDADLDPNAINGTRIQIIKQLLEIGASFDQGAGFQNQRLVETARFNDNRRRELVSSNDQMRPESLQLTREISQLKIERAKITDATSDRAKELDAEIDNKTVERDAINKNITDNDTEIQKLGPEPSGTPSTPSPSPSPFDKNRLPTSILDKLGDDEVKKLLTRDRDPRLNASTMLDNTIGLQYEIIAKQLTLLRDEVGPGERLVFLELPQSIYTTPGDGDEKMAQSWWHVNGYTRTDPLVRLLLELFEIEKKWREIKAVPAFNKLKDDLEKAPCDDSKEPEEPKADGKASEEAKRKWEEEHKKWEDSKEAEERLKKDEIGKHFFRLKCERERARESVLGNLYREGDDVFARVEQNGARDTSDLVEAIRKVISVYSPNKQGDKDNEGDKFFVGLTGGNSNVPSETQEQTRHDGVRDIRNELLRLLSDKDSIEAAEDAKFNDYKERFKIERGMEFIRLDERPAPARDGASVSIERRTVRTVDIIPRQSSLNVNDVQETVKATGILAAFKFLFGFAGQVNFQRQKEQFEQFVHQEMYASGFGKGNRDFGWTFGALPGTKRVAPGVRTTYAALIVPDDAESIVLSARGCYFPRKNYQPLNFEDTRDGYWGDDDKFKRYNCGEEQTYILPIPGGGDTSNFWVTNVDFDGGKKGGDYVTVSVRGNNFSSQIGVLVNGVPLYTTVGLAQPNLMPRRAGANGTVVQPESDCPSTVTGICGRYERIDPEQLIFSVRMPADYVGTPTITLVAPGKSVDLNNLPNLRINGKPNLTLASNQTLMFGKRPAVGLAISDFQILNVAGGPGGVLALLTGGGFAADDEIYVNGQKIDGAAKEFKSPQVFRLTFDLPAEDTLKVTLIHTDEKKEQEVVSKTIPNPAALKLTNTTVLSYEPSDGKKKGVMIVKLEGLGFTQRLQLGVEEGAAPSPVSRRVIVSPTEAIVTLIDPGPLAVFILRDNETTSFIRAVVQRPADKKGEN